MLNDVHIPHFQELLEGAMRDFLVAVNEDTIFCQTAIHQFFHMSAHPIFA
jgi:hypothetical protein